MEAAFQGGVFLYVLAVFVERCGAYHVQLSPGQHGLQHVPGVHRPFGGAGTDHGVQLVHEQQDASFRRLDLGQHGLQPLLELPPVLRPGQQRTHVQGENRPVPQAIGHVPAHDPLGQSLHDGRLAHPGVADQHRVVLGLAREDLDNPADLAVATDNGVEPPRTGVGDEVAPIFLQCFVSDFGHGRRHPLVAAHGRKRLQEPVPAQTLVAQQAPGGAVSPLVEEGDHEVLDRHVLVLQPPGFTLGRLEETR